MTVKIPYNSGIWRVWINGETHGRVGDRVTPESKKMFNKYQPINQNVKMKKRKEMMIWLWCGLTGA